METITSAKWIKFKVFITVCCHVFTALFREFILTEQVSRVPLQFFKAIVHVVSVCLCCLSDLISHSLVYLTSSYENINSDKVSEEDLEEGLPYTVDYDEGPVVNSSLFEEIQFSATNFFLQRTLKDAIAFLSQTQTQNTELKNNAACEPPSADKGFGQTVGALAQLLKKENLLENGGKLDLNSVLMSSKEQKISKSLKIPDIMKEIIKTMVKGKSQKSSTNIAESQDNSKKSQEQEQTHFSEQKVSEAEETIVDDQPEKADDTQITTTSENQTEKPAIQTDFVPKIPDLLVEVDDQASTGDMLSDQKGKSTVQNGSNYSFLTEIAIASPQMSTSDVEELDVPTVECDDVNKSVIEKSTLGIVENTEGESKGTMFTVQAGQHTGAQPQMCHVTMDTPTYKVNCVLKDNVQKVIVASPDGTEVLYESDYFDAYTVLKEQSR